MQENFDCTQFITFDSVLSENEIVARLLSFENIGLKVVSEKKIINIKKDYFKKYRSSIFIELQYDDFIGEIDEWRKINEDPPKIISDFVKITKELVNEEEINNFKIILSSFADMGKTIDKVLNTSSDKMEESLFYISMNSPYPPIDNLIIEVDK